MRRRPSRSCTSVDSAGSTAVGTSGWLVANRPVSRFSRSTTVSRSACSRSSPAARPWSSPEVRSCSTPRHRRVRGQVAVGLAARAVDHQPGQRHLLRAQPLDEVRRLAQRVRLGRGDHQERRTPVLEQLEGALRPLPEAAEERVERGDERLHVLEHLGADDLGDRVGHHPEAGGHQPRRAACRREQQLHEPAVEEAREPLGGVEEVQRAARGRGVDHDQVPAAGPPRVLVELAELLHRHVLLRARERAGDRDVERVVQDLLGLLRAGLALHHLVEGALHVEHHRVERAALAGRARRQPGHRPRGVVERLDAHRLRQPTGRVDGEHDDLAAALGRTQGERGRGGGLADAAGAAAHDDAAAAVVEQRVDVEDLLRVVRGDQRADAGAGAASSGGWWRPRSCQSPSRQMTSASS